MSKVLIYPAFDAYYYSFYFEGLRSVFGNGNLLLTCSGFPQISPGRLGFIVDKTKIIVDAYDSPKMDQTLLDWCDIYAKVNIDPTSLNASNREKLIPIGPSFGIRTWSLFSTLRQAVLTYTLVRSEVKARNHFSNFWRQFKYRLPESSYSPSISSNKYVFFAGTIWKKEAQTNQFRARFIEACRLTSDIKFEGGFAPREKQDVSGFEHLTMQTRYPFDKYFSKIKTSAVAFNTPAVFGCHGWKLGEFLALGKAIISTPLTRMLPQPLIHEQHIHLVDGSLEQIRDAIDLITQDNAYRTHLEQEARRYYMDNLAPTTVVRQIIQGMPNQSYTTHPV